MSNNKEDSALKPKDLVFLLAIAGRLDAQDKILRFLAQKLDNDRYVYHAYAIVDSLSSSYSMFKYFFDVFLANGDPNLMHKVLTSPAGIVGVVAETLFLVSFSFLASVYEKEKKDEVKKFIASAWPYVRDVLKGLKNAYKGWRSTVQMLGPLLEMNLKYLTIPVGFGLGIFAAVLRFWLRDMVERRKKLMDGNKELYLEIEQISPLTHIDKDFYLSRIGYQDEEERTHAYLAVAAGGIVDGLYLYVGVMALSALAPPLLLAMSVFTGLYVLSCSITKIYEEYDFQRRLEITQTKCKLVVLAKELETVHVQLLSLQRKLEMEAEDWIEMKHLKLEFCELIQELDEQRQLLKKQTTYTYLTAALLGMKYGLYGYGVLTSILFMVSSLFLASATAFPPVLLAVFILSGFVLMVGFIAYHLQEHYLHVQRQENEKDSEVERSYAKLQGMKQSIEQDETEILSAETFNQSLKDALPVNRASQIPFLEWFEVFRSLAAGLSKGNNFASFVATPLQELDSEGHYQDTSLVNGLGMISSLVFSLVLGLRAFARGLRGTPPSTPSAPTPTEGKSKTQLFRDSSDSVNKKSPDSQNDSFISQHRFFPKPVLSKSNNALSLSKNTTLGLE